MAEVIDYPSHEYHCDPCAFAELDGMDGGLSVEANDRLLILEEIAIRGSLEDSTAADADLAVSEAKYGHEHPFTQHHRAGIGCGHIIMEGGCPFFQADEVEPSSFVLARRPFGLVEG